MAGLKLKLRPEEQILINGAIIQNGSHQTELTVKTPDTKILRLRDAIHPDEANTPVKRVCYIAQMAVAGEVSEAEAYIQFTQGVKDLQNVFLDDGSQKIMKLSLDEAETYNFYKAMQFMRKLLPYEEALLLKCSSEALNPRTVSQTATSNLFALKDLHDKLLTEHSMQDEEILVIKQAKKGKAREKEA